MGTIYDFLNKQDAERIGRLEDHRGSWKDDLNKIGVSTFTLMATIDATKKALSTNDIVQAITIPANTFVKEVCLHIETAEGATCTVDVGDGTTADGFLNGVSANAAADTVFVATIDAGNGAYTTGANNSGKYYGSEDTIDVVMKNNAANLIMDVVAICHMTSRLR